MRKYYTEEQRAELVRLVVDEGMSPRRAAARMKIPDSTAYQWVERATNASGKGKRRAEGAPAFVRLVRAEEQRDVIRVQVGAAMLEVSEGFNADLLRQVVAALAEAAP